MYSDYVAHSRYEEVIPDYDQDVKDWIMAIFVANGAENFIRSAQTSSDIYTVYMIANNLTEADVKDKIRQEKARKEADMRREAEQMMLIESLVMDVEEDVLDENLDVARQLQGAIAIDCEMAAYYNVHRMVSVGAVDYQGREVFSAVVCPNDWPLSLEHTPGLSMLDVEKGRPERQVLQELQVLCKDKIVVFHDKRADLSVMPGVFPAGVVDTLELVGKSLDEALVETGGDLRRKKHEAVEDARGTMVLLRRLLARQVVQVDWRRYRALCRVDPRPPTRCPKLYSGLKQQQLEAYARVQGVEIKVKATAAMKRKHRDEQTKQAERALARQDRWRMGFLRFFRDRDRSRRLCRSTTVTVIRRPREVFVRGLPKEIPVRKWAKILWGTSLELDIESSRWQGGCIVLTIRRRRDVLIWAAVFSGWRGAEVVAPDPPDTCRWVASYRSVLDLCVRSMASVDDIGFLSSS